MNRAEARRLSEAIKHVRATLDRLAAAATGLATDFAADDLDGGHSLHFARGQASAMTNASELVTNSLGEWVQ